MLLGPKWGPAALLTYLVVHLLRAVEDIHHGAQGSAQVLGCLRLARASGACRGSAHDQVEGLRERDVAPAGEDLDSPAALGPYDPHPTGLTVGLL